jgi:hypothetical protein
MSRGTPKTLQKAIENGIEDGDIEHAVADFIRQKLTWGIIKASYLGPECEKLMIQLGEKFGFEHDTGGKYGRS